MNGRTPPFAIDGVLLSGKGYRRLFEGHNVAKVVLLSGEKNFLQDGKVTKTVGGM